MDDDDGMDGGLPMIGKSHAYVLYLWIFQTEDDLPPALIRSTPTVDLFYC